MKCPIREALIGGSLRDCITDECAWFTSNDGCAVSAIAEKLRCIDISSCEVMGQLTIMNKAIDSVDDTLEMIRMK